MTRRNGTRSRLEQRLIVAGLLTGLVMAFGCAAPEATGHGGSAAAAETPSTPDDRASPEATNGAGPGAVGLASSAAAIPDGPLTADQVDAATERWADEACDCPDEKCAMASTMRFIDAKNRGPEDYWARSERFEAAEARANECLLALEAAR